MLHAGMESNVVVMMGAWWLLYLRQLEEAFAETDPRQYEVTSGLGCKVRGRWETCREPAGLHSDMGKAKKVVVQGWEKTARVRRRDQRRSVPVGLYWSHESDGQLDARGKQSHTYKHSNAEFTIPVASPPSANLFIHPLVHSCWSFSFPRQKTASPHSYQALRAKVCV